VRKTRPAPAGRVFFVPVFHVKQSPILCNRGPANSIGSSVQNG
jgi:hypothetical protein